MRLSLIGCYKDHILLFDVDASGVRSITLLSMCGRYVRRSGKQKIAEHFSVHGPSLPDFGPSWNVAPQTFQPVIRLARDTGQREIALMRWGLILFWAKEACLRKTPMDKRQNAPRLASKVLAVLTIEFSLNCRTASYSVKREAMSKRKP